MNRSKFMIVRVTNPGSIGWHTCGVDLATWRAIKEATRTEICDMLSQFSVSMFYPILSLTQWMSMCSEQPVTDKMDDR